MSVFLQEDIVDGVLKKNCKRVCEGEIVIPEGVKEIEEFAFTDYGRITAVQLPESLEKIGMFAFSGCCFACFCCLAMRQSRRYSPTKKQTPKTAK
jgi:hypothetical protein